MTTALIIPTYSQLLNFYNHFVQLHGDAQALQTLLSTTTTTSSFATWLNGTGNRARFEQLLSVPAGAAAVCASTQAMTLILSSNTAWNSFQSSSVAMNALVASSGAMGLVAASNTAMTAIAASSVATNVLVTSNSAMNTVVSSNTAMTAIAASNVAMNVLVGSNSAMSKVAAYSISMTAIAASSVAMNVLVGSSSAMNTVVVSTTAMTAIAASNVAMNVLVASSSTMNTVATSGAAMTAIAASNTAMAIVAASTIAMNALNASTTAMDAVYASPLVTKVSYVRAALWSGTVTLRSGIGLFVRLTTFAGGAGWGEGSSGNEYMIYDSSNAGFSERAANPYNHTSLTASPRHPMRKFTTKLGIRPYQAVEIAYMPLTA